MMKEPNEDQLKNLKLSVFMRNGAQYTNCDTTTKPFGDDASVVSVWENDKLIVIPMSQVEKVSMRFDLE